MTNNGLQKQKTTQKSNDGSTRIPPKRKNAPDAGALEQQAVPAFTSGISRVTAKRHAHHVMCKSCWIHKEYGYEIHICSSYLRSN